MGFSIKLKVISPEAEVLSASCDHCPSTGTRHCPKTAKTQAELAIEFIEGKPIILVQETTEIISENLVEFEELPKLKIGRRIHPNPKPSL